jgi:hypothetical protein
MAARNQIRCPQCGVPNDPGALFCSRCGASQNRPGYTGTRSGRVSLAGATMALACLIGLAVTAFVLYTIVTRVVAPTAHAATSTTVYSGSPGTLATLNTSTTVGPTTSTTADGTTSKGSILVRPQAATASSSLTPTNLNDFRPTNLLDGDVSTAWVEGAAGTGARQWVKFQFEQPITLARIEIANGYQKSAEFFADYVRVKSLQVDYSDGSRQVIQLQDEQGLQVMDPKTTDNQPITTQWIKFTILTVYPAYKWPQAALSDIHIYEVVQ